MQSYEKFCAGLKYIYIISLKKKFTIYNLVLNPIPWNSGHEGLKKIFAIGHIFIYVIPYAHLYSVLTKIEVTSKLISLTDTFIYNQEIFPKLASMKIKILNFIFLRK